MQGERGFALIAAVVIMVLLGATGIFAVSMLSTDIGIASDTLRSTQAFFIADAGLQHAIYKLKNDSDYRDSGYATPETGDLGAGSFSVSVSKSGDDYTLTSTGTVGVVTRKAEQVATVSGGAGGGSYPGGVPEAFEYAMHSFGSHTKFKDSTGTINGDVASANSVQDSSDPTINGDVTSGSTVPTPFSVDMDGYKSIADNVEAGGFTFAEGTTYGSSGSEQIWYIQGNVTIEEGVTIYGSVIAENNITLGDEDITIDAASGYPALIAGNNIGGDGLEDSTISGLIAAENNVDFDNLGGDTGVTINGTILSGNNTSMRNGENFTVNYDSDIMANPPPYFQGFSTAATVTLGTWKETF